MNPFIDSEISEDLFEGIFSVSALAVLSLVGFGLISKADPGRRFAVSVPAMIWVASGIVIVDWLAADRGWWLYELQSEFFFFSPPLLFIPWVLIWSLSPLALGHSPRPLLTALSFLLVDILIMPLMDPWVKLGDRWWIGELLLIVLVAIPSVILSSLIYSRKRLKTRVALMVFVFSWLVLFAIPMTSSQLTGVEIGEIELQAIVIWSQPLFLLSVPGIAAVYELLERANGTPYPWDPPEKVVTSGPYAYMSNPMQLSGFLVLLLVAAVLAHWPTLVAGLTALFFSVGIAHAQEQSVLSKRWGSEWENYKSEHRNWIPRFKPKFSNSYRATLYVDGGCGDCRQVGEWFASRAHNSLGVRDARFVKGTPLRRVTYSWTDHGSVSVSGIKAISAALDHTHLGWAFIGWALRIWPVSVIAQLVSDVLLTRPHEAIAGPEDREWYPSEANRLN